MKALQEALNNKIALRLTYCEVLVTGIIVIIIVLFQMIFPS